MKYIVSAVTLLTLSCCTSLKSLPDSDLRSGYYEFRQVDTHYARVYADVNGDSVAIIPIDKKEDVVKPLTTGAPQFFLKRSFDLDVLTVPFKYRPSSFGFPRQLTVDFNGSVFLGYRFDRYKVQSVQTPARLLKKIGHRALTMGVFGGIGTSSITPSTTNYQTIDDYNGFILNRGLSLMAGVNNLTVGIGVGWDYLTDRDKDIWIYQNKPWYGLTLSLNLN